MKRCAFFILTASLGLAAPAARATTVDIGIPYTSTGSVLYNNQWSQAIQGSSIITAPTNGNQSGPTFTYWAGQFNGTGSGSTTALTFTGLPVLGNASTVNTLMNTFFGSYFTLDATVTFTNSANQSESYLLIGAETIRDYYNNNGNNYSNSLTGVDGAPTDPQDIPAGIGTPGVVTAQEWWNNYGDSMYPQGDPNTEGVRLDEQTFYLPSSWAGTTLTGMTIIDNGNAGNGTEITLSALQLVDANTVPGSATPEPSSFVLLGTGLASLASAIRRKMRKT